MKVRFYSIAVPFILSQWIPFSLEFKGSPKVEVNKDALTIETDESAGGFAYLFEKPFALKKDTKLS